MLAFCRVCSCPYSSISANFPKGNALEMASTDNLAHFAEIVSSSSQINVVSSEGNESLETTPLLPDDDKALLLSQIESRIRDFEVPQGYVVVRGKPGMSVLYTTGVLLQNLVTKRRIWWSLVCVPSRRINCKTSTSPATTHLRNIHAMESEKSRKVHTRKNNFRSSVECLEKKTGSGGERSKREYGLMVAKVICKKGLPVSIVEDDDVRALMSADRRDKFPVNLHSAKIKHHIVELYSATKYALTKDIREELVLHNIPYIHLGVDLWTSSVSKQKFVGVRASYVSQNWKKKSVLLAVRPFTLSSQTMKAEQSSSSIHAFVRDILSEHKISEVDHIAGCTTDAGADIKRLCSELIPAPWDWCLPHLLNCAVQESMGTSLKPSASNNPEARALLSKLKRVVEHLKKSRKATVKFEEIQISHLGFSYKLGTDVPHRWCNTAKLLGKVLKLWSDLREYYEEGEKKDFPLQVDRTHYLHVYALLYPVIYIIETTQTDRSPKCSEALLLLLKLRESVLSEGSPLQIINPADAAGSALQSVPDSEISDIAKNIRKKLYDALEKRFFRKYTNPNSSECYFHDVACALHPSLRGLKYLERLSAQNAGKVREFVWKYITDMAFKSLEKDREEIGLIDREDHHSPYLRRGRSAGIETQRNETDPFSLSSFAEFADITASPGVAKVSSDTQRLLEEIENYRAEEPVSLSQVPLDAVLQWWSDNEFRFPTMARVARSVLGHPTSSAAIERDFGMAGKYLCGLRNRMDGELLELMLYLSANSHLIPTDIPPLESAEVLDRIPGRCKKFTSNSSDSDSSVSPS